MRRHEYWQQRLLTAVSEAEDADRVWRQAMAATPPSGGGAAPAHVLWREREDACARMHQVQLLVDQAQARSAAKRRLRLRLQSAAQTAAFLRWHVATRLQRPTG